MSSRPSRRSALSALTAATTMALLPASAQKVLAMETTIEDDRELQVFWLSMTIHERCAIIFPEQFPEAASEVRRRYGAYLRLCRRCGLSVTYLDPRVSSTDDWELKLVPIATAPEGNRPNAPTNAPPMICGNS
jgi:hypothetical protein